MQYRGLGSSGVPVSRPRLGTGNLGRNESFAGDLAAPGEDEAFPIMAAALDLVVNFFETAKV